MQYNDLTLNLTEIKLSFGTKYNGPEKSKTFTRIKETNEQQPALTKYFKFS